MNLDEALPALRAGKRIRRKGWPEGEWIDPESLDESLAENQLLETDWEVESGLGLKQCCFVYGSGRILSLVLEEDVTAETLSELIRKTFQ